MANAWLAFTENVWRLFTLALLATLPIALYTFWFRREEWTRTQRLYKTFAILASASTLLVFGDTVGIRLARLVELGVLGFGYLSLALWAYFGAEANRERRDSDATNR